MEDSEGTDYPYHAEILFGDGGEHHLSLYGTDADSVLDYVHYLSLDDDMPGDLIRGILDSIDDDRLEEDLDAIGPCTIMELMEFISDRHVCRYERVVQGILLSEKEKGEGNYISMKGREVTVGMVYNFGGDQTVGNAVTSILGLFIERRLHESLLDAHKHMDEGGMRTVFLNDNNN